MLLEVLVDGIGYPESPRFHDDELWFSDFDAKLVRSANSSGALEDHARVDGTPSGLAFRDGELLVVSMNTQHVLRAADQLPVADLSHLAVGHLNDMVAAPDGTLFVGCFGYDLSLRERPRPGPLLAIDPDGTTRIAWPDVTFANGMAIADGGRTLLVAESPRSVITRFAIKADGSLTDRSIAADLRDRKRQPDGICVDAEGGIWMGSPFSEEFIRVDAGGEITHVVPTPGRWAIACELGGPDGDTFFGLTAETDLDRFDRGESAGRIEVARAPEPRKLDSWI